MRQKTHGRARPKTRKVLRLRKLRRDREMTQRELGRRVGLHTTMISEIESGEKLPSLTKARELATEFGVTIEELFEQVEVPA